MTRTGHTVCQNEFHLSLSWHQAVKFTWSKIKYKCKYIHRLYLLTYTYICIYCFCLIAKSCPTLWQSHAQQPTRLLCPWDSPGKNTAVGCHALLKRIFPTQGLNPYLLHWQADCLPLSQQGIPMYIYTYIHNSPIYIHK